MTRKNHKSEVQENKASQNKNLMKWLESDILDLINDEKNGLSDLKAFSKNLTSKKSNNVLTKHNLDALKADLQDWWLVDFQWWDINGKVFGFEVIGNDIEPVLTPNGDCLIPINFRYDSQRRTKLLVLHIENQDWDNVYTVPDWDNEYKIEIGKETWVYYLQYDNTWFHMLLQK